MGMLSESFYYQNEFDALPPLHTHNYGFRAYGEPVIYTACNECKEFWMPGVPSPPTCLLNEHRGWAGHGGIYRQLEDFVETQLDSEPCWFCAVNQSTESLHTKACSIRCLARDEAFG
jgi:hypothetical protein